VSRKRRSIALLWCPKLSCVPNGSGTLVSGSWRCSRSISTLGTFSGTLRIPSRSSENTTSRVGIPEMSSKARRTMVVRSTSPKVPRCGSPEGP
jgi:hypothetical protein